MGGETKTMKVAIVGSRGWKDERAVTDFVNALPAGTTVISGGAKGVDKMAENAALRRYPDLELRLFTPDWRKHGKSAGMIRNGAIVEAADRVVAWWDGVSKGTADTISRAVKAKKPVEIHYPDGRVEHR